MRNRDRAYRLLLLLAGLLVAAGASLLPRQLASASEGAAPVRLEVDLSERKLHVYHGSERMNTFEVAIGAPEHPTPTGDFGVDRIEWNPDWVPPNEGWAEGEERQAPNDPDNPMRGAKLFFKYPDYYIHGTDEPHTLGQAASHGCIRMHPGDVMSLAKFVQEHGGASRSDEWYERVRRNDASEHKVTLSDAVPLSIRE